MLAAGGNDRCLRVYDVRSSDPLVASAPDVHSCAINCVKWHPTDPNCLISSSFDPDIPVHDLRKLNNPLHLLSGHHATAGKIKLISRPIFWGDSLITNGERSDRLSVYDVSSGKATSRGSLGFQPVSMFCSRSKCPSERILAVSNTSAEIYLCPPVYK